MTLLFNKTFEITEIIDSWNFIIRETLTLGSIRECWDTFKFARSCESCKIGEKLEHSSNQWKAVEEEVKILRKLRKLQIL